MKYTPAEVAALLANRPNQPHYVKALIEKCVKVLFWPSVRRARRPASSRSSDGWMTAHVMPQANALQPFAQGAKNERH